RNYIFFFQLARSSSMGISMRSLVSHPPFLRRGAASAVASLALAGLLSAVGGCQQGADAPAPPPNNGLAPPGPPLFEDVTEASGVKMTYRNGEEAGHYAILESLGGGVALIDYDGDGL